MLISVSVYAAALSVLSDISFVSTYFLEFVLEFVLRLTARLFIAARHCECPNCRYLRPDWPTLLSLLRLGARISPTRGHLLLPGMKIFGIFKLLCLDLAEALTTQTRPSNRPSHSTDSGPGTDPTSALVVVSRLLNSLGRRFEFRNPDDSALQHSQRKTSHIWLQAKRHLRNGNPKIGPVVEVGKECNFPFQ